MENDGFRRIMENTELLIKFLTQKQKQSMRTAEEAKSEIARLKKTLSWRITKPLRVVGNFVAKDAFVFTE